MYLQNMQTLIILLSTILGLTSSFYLRGAEISSRITNGTAATLGQFPYQVGLLLFINDYSPTWCGGCLISTKWVLTAAHCLVDVKYVKVYLGATSRFQSEAKYTVSKEKFTIHSSYKGDYSYKNDIALIRIPSVKLTDKIKTIELPPYFDRSNYTGTYAIASGWGTMTDGIKYAVDDLQWGRMKVISNAVCRKTFAFLVSTSMCVDTLHSASTCNGDSGGPLVSESDGVLIGLTSYGSILGCSQGFPIAFTRVTSYLKWIFHHTKIWY